MFIDTIPSPIHRDNGSHVFVQMAKYICLNCKMYWSKFHNVFVQIAERQNSNSISFVFHSHSQKDNIIYVVSCYVTWSVILSPLEYI